MTGIVLPSLEALAGGMNPFVQNVSILSDGTRFFAMDEPLQVADRLAAKLESGIAEGGSRSSYDLVQYVPIVGMARPDPRWYGRSYRFLRYRPYFCGGFHAHVTTGMGGFG